MTLKSGPANRRRGPELEEALLQAAWAVLIGNGYSGFTYDAVAARAETSRAVLYRRWPQRHLMLEQVLRRFWTPIGLPDTGNLRDDGIALLRAVNDTRAEMITVQTQQLADYFRETGTTPADLRTILGLAGRESGFEVLIARAVERGELPAAPASPRITDLPMALLRHEMVMRSGRADDDTLTEIIDAVWLPLLRQPPPHP